MLQDPCQGDLTGVLCFLPLAVAASSREWREVREAARQLSVSSSGTPVAPMRQNVAVLSSVRDIAQAWYVVHASIALALATRRRRCRSMCGVRTGRRQRVAGRG